MRVGWSCKEAAAVLDIHERRVTQSLDPTLERVARLWRMDPTKTVQAILDQVSRLEPMTDDEIRLRELMLTGKVDRHIVHPTSRRSEPSSSAAAFHR